MTDQKKWPPRVWISESINTSYVVNPMHHAFDRPTDLCEEYISTREHAHALLVARAESFEEAAKMIRVVGDLRYYQPQRLFQLMQEKAAELRKKAGEM